MIWLKRKFPKRIKGWWACGEWMLFAGQFEKRSEIPTDKFMFNPHVTIYGGSELIDGLIPGIKIGDRVGLYSWTVVEGPGPWYDAAMWDDGKKYNLKLVKVISYETLCRAKGSGCDG